MIGHPTIANCVKTSIDVEFVEGNIIKKRGTYQDMFIGQTMTEYEIDKSIMVNFMGKPHATNIVTVYS